MDLDAGMAAALSLTRAMPVEILVAPGCQPIHVIRRLGDLLPTGV